MPLGVGKLMDSALTVVGLSVFVLRGSCFASMAMGWWLKRCSRWVFVFDEVRTFRAKITQLVNDGEFQNESILAALQVGMSASLRLHGRPCGRKVTADVFECFCRKNGAEDYM